MPGAQTTDLVLDFGHSSYSVPTITFCAPFLTPSSVRETTPKAWSPACVSPPQDLLTMKFVWGQHCSCLHSSCWLYHYSISHGTAQSHLLRIWRSQAQHTVCTVLSVYRNGGLLCGVGEVGRLCSRPLKSTSPLKTRQKGQGRNRGVQTTYKGDRVTLSTQTLSPNSKTCLFWIATVTASSVHCTDSNENKAKFQYNTNCGGDSVLL